MCKFWLPLPNFWKRDWSLVFRPNFEIFFSFPNFIKILSFKLFGNSRSNLYTKFIMLEIKSGFTCSQLNVHGNTVTWKNSMSLNFFVCQIKTSWWRLYSSCNTWGCIGLSDTDEKTSIHFWSYIFILCMSKHKYHGMPQKTNGCILKRQFGSTICGLKYSVLSIII